MNGKGAAAVALDEDGNACDRKRPADVCGKALAQQIANGGLVLSADWAG
jgi:hypothetical protein